MGRKIRDLTGLSFGRLTVVALNSGGSHASWKCVCSCGTSVVRMAATLHRSITPSCGCYMTQRSIEYNKSRTMPVELAAAKSIYGTYMVGASKRNLDFTLSLEDFTALIRKNCDYCGRPPSNAHRKRVYLPSFLYSGLDRVNNNLGYSTDNCLPCCKSCNWSKGKKTHTEFLAYLDDLVAHRVKKEAK